MKKRNHSRVRSRLFDFRQLEDRRLLASLANGQEVTSSIGIGQQESFDFQVNTAGTVIVSVGETANFGANPFLELFGPSGSSLGTSTSETDATLRFVDLQPGTYTAIVSDEFSDESLGFSITAEFEDTSLLGDANLDGDVNFLDIAPFISLLSGNDFLDEADVNRDGSVDFLDISPFIGLLSSGGSAQAISNLNSPEIPSGSAVTSETIVVEPPVSSPVLATTVTEETPVDTYTGPVASTPDRYSLLDARSSSLSDFERNRPFVNHRPLTQNSQSHDSSYESRQQHPSATVPAEGSFSTAAELFDAHPESLDEVLDFTSEETLAGLIE